MNPGSDSGECPTDGGIPDDLACTGLYSDWTTKTIASDVQAYTPGLVFFSDGAVKSRWIYLPPGKPIDTNDAGTMDNWIFPVGTKIWKQFVVDGALLETRLIWKTDAYDWAYLDYRWSADGTTAQRLDTGETNVNGTSYEIPATNACPDCHGLGGYGVDAVLGFDYVGLGVAGAQGVTLASLEAQGAFTANPPSTVVVIPDDNTGKAAQALGWLHVNCGITCHNANPNVDPKAAGTGLLLKLIAAELVASDGGRGSVTSLDSYTTTVGVAAIYKVGGMTVQRIDPGNPGASLMSILAGTRCAEDAGSGDAGVSCLQMPPLVSHITDDAGLAALSGWIGALGPAGDP